MCNVDPHIKYDGINLMRDQEMRERARSSYNKTNLQLKTIGSRPRSRFEERVEEELTRLNISNWEARASNRNG